MTTPPLKATLAAWQSAPFDEAGFEAAMDEIKARLAGRLVLIHGAGALGQLLLATLRGHNIGVHAFVDRAATLLGNVDQIPVHEPQYLAGLGPDVVVIIASNSKPRADAMAQAIIEIQPAAEVLDGFAVNRILRSTLCRRLLDEGWTFDLIQCENCGFEGKGCGICSSYLRRVGGAEVGENDWRCESFDWFGYIVGQRCTLKCVHCCEAIPRLREHAFVDHDIVVSDVAAMAKASRFLNFVELIGGEPFLHPQIGQILASLLAVENIGYVKVFTNGTVVPSDSLCDILTNPRLMLQMSNYAHQVSGTLLRNIQATRRKLADRGVRYIFTPVPEWQDFSSFDLHHPDDAVLPTVFRACPLRNCHRLYKGVLYRCPHQYAGVQLGRLDALPVETVQIAAKTPKELASALTAFEDVSYIDACRYCTLPFDAKVVPAGEQIISSSNPGEETP